MGARVLAVANQKGGVAKTTTVHALAAALAEREHAVLMVDLDPQACLTYAAGEEPDRLDLSLHNVLVGGTPVADTVLKVGEVHLVPSTIDLAGAEVQLFSRTGREYALATALEPLLGAYDYVLIDCPPSLGILTINGLTAASEVVIPLQCETLSHRGVGQLLDTVDDVRAYTNRQLEVLGVVATMYDRRTNLARLIPSEVEATYDLPVLPPPIPKTVRVAESPSRGKSVLEHAPRSTAAIAYRELAAGLDAA
jgi:chromosome partitioning protein